MKNILKSFVLASAVCLGVVSASAQAGYEEKPLMTIGCLSDTHADDNYIGTDGLRESLTRTLQKMAENEDVDLLLFGGDMTGGATGGGKTENEWKKTRELYVSQAKDVFKNSGKNPYMIFTTGNHEYMAGQSGSTTKTFNFNSGDWYTSPMKDVCGELTPKNTPTADPGECLEEYLDGSHKGIVAFHYQVNGMDFVVLNTGKYLYAKDGNYSYSIESVNWIAAKMDAIYQDNPDKTVFFLTHIPFSDSNGISTSSKGMQNDGNNSADVLKKALARHPNIIMLYGHDHGGENAYIRTKTSERITRYDTSGQKLSAVTDDTHIEGLVQANAKVRGMKMAGGAGYYLYNAKSGAYLSMSSASALQVSSGKQKWSFGEASGYAVPVSTTYNSKTYYLTGGTSFVPGTTEASLYLFEYDSDNGSDKINLKPVTSVTAGGKYYLVAKSGSSFYMLRYYKNTLEAKEVYNTNTSDYYSFAEKVTDIGESTRIVINTQRNEYSEFTLESDPTQKYGELTVAAGEHGTATIDGVSGNVWEGSVLAVGPGSMAITLKAAPSDGYVLKGWSTDGKESGIIEGSNVSPYNYMFTFGSEDEGAPTSLTLTAIFGEKPKIEGTLYLIKNSDGKYVGLNSSNALSVGTAKQTWGFSGFSSDQCTVQTADGNGNIWYLQGGDPYSVSTSPSNLYFYEVSSTSATTANRVTALTAGKQYLIVYSNDGYYYLMDKDGNRVQINSSGTTKPVFNSDKNTITLSSQNPNSASYKFTLETVPVPLYGLFTAVPTTGGSVYVAETNNATDGRNIWTGCVESNTGSASKTLYLYAKPNSGYRFKGWSETADGNVFSNSSNSPYRYDFNFSGKSEATATVGSLYAQFEKIPEPSFITSFIGSMDYWNNTPNGNNQNKSKANADTDVYQALMIYVYADRIVLQMKNFGNSGDFGSYTKITVNKELTPYTIIRDVVADGGEGQVVFNDGDGEDEVIDAKEEGLTVTDKDDIRKLVVKRKVENVNINYKRSFEKTCWQTWCTPFGFQWTGDLKDRFVFAKPAGAFIDSDGQTYVAFILLKDGEWVNANIPYMVKAKTAGDKTVTLNGVTLMPNGNIGNIKITSFEHEFRFVGLCETKCAPEDKAADWYSLTDDGTFEKAEAGSEVSSLRCIVEVSPREDNIYRDCGPVSQNVKSIRFMVIGEDDEETGIEQVGKGVYDRGTKASDRTNPVFDLSGRRAGNAEGVVIENKKVILKMK